MDMEMTFQPISFLMATIVILLLVIVYQNIIHSIERKRLVQHNDELLNRLMSRDFTAYAAGAAISQPAARRTLGEFFNKVKTQKDREDKEEEEAALGMPVT
jgi:hypothetical protein